MSKNKKLMIVGMGRAGKDTAGEYLGMVTNLKFAGTTSLYLAKYVAQRLGVSTKEAYANRHESNDMRKLWYDTGRQLRALDPGVLIRESMEFGDIIGGVRDVEEIETARRENLVDLIVWIENRRVPPDPTVMFDESVCDIVIQNNGSLEEFYTRLDRFAAFAGLAKGAA